MTGVQSRWWHLMDVARRGALNLIFFGIYALIFVQTAQGAWTLGVMVLLLQLVAMARQPVQMMSFLVDASQRAVAGTRDYFVVMDEAPGAPATLATPVAEGFVRPAWPVVAGAPAIEFDHVTFGYDEASDVLRDVTFSVAAGERVAFVGESGGGKTTLVNLLLGLYRPDTGHIRLFGTDVAGVGARELRCQIGVVFQDASLFSGTIRDNITYGRPDAPDAEVLAARRANAHEFVARPEQGYAAQIGERGIKLSGGQKQRIAVARATLKDAPILVLDEATERARPKSERLVQAGLDELMNDRTSLIIAHRLSTISTVDRIVTLADGRVDEIGTPAELARSGGIYAELLALQASASKADQPAAGPVRHPRVTRPAASALPVHPGRCGRLDAVKAGRRQVVAGAVAGALALALAGVGTHGVRPGAQPVADIPLHPGSVRQPRRVLPRAVQRRGAPQRPVRRGHEELPALLRREREAAAGRGGRQGDREPARGGRRALPGIHPDEPAADAPAGRQGRPGRHQAGEAGPLSRGHRPRLRGGPGRVRRQPRRAARAERRRPQARIPTPRPCTSSATAASSSCGPPRASASPTADPSAAPEGGHVPERARPSEVDLSAIRR